MATQLESARADAKPKLDAAVAAKDAANMDDEAKKAAAASHARQPCSRHRCKSWKWPKQAPMRRSRRPTKSVAAADQAKTRAEDLKQKAAAKAAELAAQFDAAKAEAQPKLDALAGAKDAAKAAEKKKADTAKASNDAKLALEPVSIYISRATKKLYVRRNTHKPAPDGGGEVFDTSIEVPVTIRDADKRIGTHIFTAMAKTDTGLRWSSVTIDGANTAKDALDRITIPQEVVDRIGPTALPRSSIVISDEPLSKETNYRTEFVTVLADQPQGGFITRKPTPPPVAVASQDDFFGFGFGFQRNPEPPVGNPRTRGGQPVRQELRQEYRQEFPRYR